MSSLYVKVFTNFYTHRKTMRLFSILGESAFWIPPRLWSYAAENQPNGDFSDYSPEEIALLINYSGNAQAMLQALNKSGFLDNQQLHDWEEYNGYHTTFAERAKKGAAARWGKKQTQDSGEEKTGNDKIGDERKGKEASNASSIAPFAHIPSEKEFVALCGQFFIPEFYAVDKFLARDAEGWKNGNWKSYVRRVKGWYENDGKPTEPKKGNHNGKNHRTEADRDRDNTGISSDIEVPIFKPNSQR